MTFPSHSRLWHAAVTTLLVAVATVARGDEIADIGKLLKAGQLEQASQRADAFLASRPRDAQGQFLKGLILTEQNKTAEAIAAFTRLTELYPELPEPYNNLAVLYAGQSQYERARQALEMAIRTHPSYATAHENLGDVYAKLASQAYDKALQLDSNNSAAQTKLALVRDLIGGGNRPRPQVAQASPTSTKGAPAQAAVPALPTAVAAPAAPPPAKDVRVAPPKESVREAAKPANQESDVIAAVNAWASAWARKDVATYLGAYAKDFKLPRGESRQAWESSRKQRIEAPKKIDVKVESPVVDFTEAGIATVKFRQDYKSNIVSARSSKTLVMTKTGSRWQIREERSGS